MDITEVARRSGIPPSALRFYEQKGLIASVGRKGLRRQFAPDVLVRLALIALGQGAGFTLDEVGRLFGSGRQPRIDRGMLADKADELDRTIRRLRAVRTSLRHAVVCQAPCHMECPAFRRFLSAALPAATARHARASPSRRRRRGAFS